MTTLVASSDDPAPPTSGRAERRWPMDTGRRRAAAYGRLAADLVRSGRDDVWAVACARRAAHEAIRAMTTGSLARAGVKAALRFARAVRRVGEAVHTTSRRGNAGPSTERTESNDRG